MYRYNEDDGDWEVIYEGEEGTAGSGDDGVGGEYGEYEDDDDDDDEEEGRFGSGSGSFDEGIGGGGGGGPVMSFLLRVRGYREVEGAGGATNLTPVVHLVPLVGLYTFNLVDP